MSPDTVSSTPARRLRWINRLVIAVPVALLVYAAWERRWVTDDAFINFRVVDHILAGDGPVFNAGERAEAYTSTLWLLMLAAGAAVLGMDAVEWISVLLGLVLTAFGLVGAGLGALRLSARDGGVALPVGLLAMVALAPFWDFATSGLETGLAFGWIGGTFWALASRYGPAPPSERQELRSGRFRRALGSGPALAALAGLGPLIRPDLLVFSLGFAGLVLALEPVESWKPRLGLLAAALALPLGYEVFRMGYFASLVPNTALAKEASKSDWTTGINYLRDYVTTYELWIPAVALVVLLGLTAARIRRRDGARTVALYAVPIVCGVLHALYVVRVGGDFMHARLLLFGTFGLITPFAVVRFRPDVATLVPALVLAAWALACVTSMRPPYGPSNLSMSLIADERAYYVKESQTDHPVTAEDYRRNVSYAAGLDYRRLGERDAGVLTIGRIGPRIDPWPPVRALRSRRRTDVVAGTYRIGLTGFVAGPDVFVVDRLGLANPLGGRLELERRFRPGHEKSLPHEWVIAGFGDPSSYGRLDIYSDDPRVYAARRTLDCGELRRLKNATTGRMTPGRFVKNFFLAPSLTRLRVPADPLDAETKFCPT